MTATFLRWFFGTALLMVALLLLMGNPGLLLKIILAVAAIPMIFVVFGLAVGVRDAVRGKGDGR